MSWPTVTAVWVERAEGMVWRYNVAGWDAREMREAEAEDVIVSNGTRRTYRDAADALGMARARATAPLVNPHRPLSAPLAQGAPMKISELAYIGERAILVGTRDDPELWVNRDRRSDGYLYNLSDARTTIVVDGGENADQIRTDWLASFEARP